MVLPGPLGSPQEQGWSSGKLRYTTEPCSGFSSTLWTSSSTFLFFVIFALLFYLWIWTKGFMNLKIWMQMYVLALSLSLDHRPLHPKGLAQLWLHNWVSFFLIGLCANMQTISKVIHFLNLFKLCTSLLNVSSFLHSHFLKKCHLGPPRISMNCSSILSYRQQVLGFFPKRMVGFKETCKWL